jgi:hypothetical protein
LARCYQLYNPSLQVTLFYNIQRSNYYPEEKRPLGRLTRKWEDNIKIDLTEIGWIGMDWIHLA